MRITNINVPGLSNGSFHVVDEGNTFIQFAMTEEESERVRQVAAEIFFSRKDEFAKKISEMQPTLLADFTEVA